MPMIEATSSYRILSYRTTLAGPDGLTSINTTAIDNGAIVVVLNSIFRLDKTSVAVVDGVTVIAPSVGPGRWLLMGTGGSDFTVANLTELAALGVAAPSLVWVESLLCYWHRSPDATPPIDGITVIAAIGGWHWERITSTTSHSWLSATNWYIDPVSGDDEAAGTNVATPLQTFEEIGRRLSVGTLTHTTYIHCANVTGYPNTSTLIANSTGLIQISGASEVVYTDTFSSYTAPDHVTPQGTLIQATGIADWTQYAADRVSINVTSGSGNGAMTWISRVNPDALGNNVARVGVFANYAGNYFYDPPAPGDSFELRSYPDINNLRVSVTGGGSVIVSSLRTSSVVVNEGVVLSLYNCCVDPGGSDPVMGSVRAIYRCLINLYQGAITDTVGIEFSAITKRLSLSPFKNMSLNQTIVDTNSGASIVTGQSASAGAGYSVVNLSAVQIFNTAANQPAIDQYGDSVINVYGAVSGRAAFGLRVTPGRGPVSFLWSSGNLPNLDGSTAEIRLLMSANLDLAWATASFDSDEQTGTATLGGGTGAATVAARNANVRAVQVTRNTAAGTPGDLSVPAASRTASQFLIQSANAADTSTVDWFIPGFLEQITIGQEKLLTDPV